MQLTNKILSPTRNQALRIVYLQLLIIILVAIIWLYSSGKPAALSVLLGGIAWLIPTYFFIKKVFTSRQSRSASKITSDFFLAEVLKLFLSGVLIVCFLRIFSVFLLPFLLGYIGAVFVGFLTPLIYTKN